MQDMLNDREAALLTAHSRFQDMLESVVAEARFDGTVHHYRMKCAGIAKRIGITQKRGADPPTSKRSRKLHKTSKKPNR
eukprot:3446044-Lingulodinium_polyedra.AAC.1